MALRTILTTSLFIVIFALNSNEFAFSAESSASGEDVVAEFKMTTFNAADSYPEFQRIVSARPLEKASLRCVDYGYDGGVAWRYHELMVFDEAGPEVRRKEPRANVAVEHGHRYMFKNLEECEKALPQIIDGSATCTLKLTLNRTLGTAKFISSQCARTLPK